MTNWKEKFYIGSQWKTRGGWPAFVVAHDQGRGMVKVAHPATDEFLYHHTSGEHEGEADLLAWQQIQAWRSRLDYCLIEPWKEPREGDAAVYEHQDGTLVIRFAEEGDPGSLWKKIAVVPWVEGEGMEDSE